MHYDQLLASWIARAPCTKATASEGEVPAEEAALGQRGPAAIQLAHFRRLERLLGAHVPPCYVVDYECPMCHGVHRSLGTQDVLDWDPLQGLWPVYHDLMLGRESWSPVHSAWIDRLLKGSWPLQGWCSHRRRITGLWPTQIRTLQARVDPGHMHGHSHEVFDVCFDCPLCDGLEFETMPASRLAYGVN